MGSRSDDDDDDFNELYKAYTGPIASKPSKSQEMITSVMKRSIAGSDEEEEEKDPNAVPTDFTSRDAKVWEAKSKATERNWKKRKEEELICKLCGESGHFTQGCPTTLGANRKSQDFIERVPARESHVKALFTKQVVNQLEKDIGCKIKMEEKFIIVSGKDRLILKKGVDSVHKIKKDGEVKVASSSSKPSLSRSPAPRSPVGSRLGRSISSHFHSSSRKLEKDVEEDRLREDLQNLTRGSPPQARAYDGARSHLRSPPRVTFPNNSDNSYGPHRQGMMGGYRMDGWDADRHGLGIFPNAIEELSFEYQREANELCRLRDKREEEENYKHREAVREIRENHVKEMNVLRGIHARQWDEFLQLDARKRQQQAVRYDTTTSGFGGYRKADYPEYVTNLPMESQGLYPNPGEIYPSSSSSGPRVNYGDFEHRRHKDYGKGYDRF